MSDVSDSEGGVDRAGDSGVGVERGAVEGEGDNLQRRSKAPYDPRGSLKAKTKFVKDTDWGGNTDFRKVFDVLVHVAVNGNPKAEEMIKRLFVFRVRPGVDESVGDGLRGHREEGYGDCVPEIVFWNLRDSRATPVPSDQPGVALVSGYSKNFMKIFLEKGGVVDPEAVMEAAISGKEYQKLVVLD